MKAVQLKCKQTGKMKYVSRCIKKNCANLVAVISRTEKWRISLPKLTGIKLGVNFKCKAE